MWTHNTGVASSNPTRVTIKMPLGNHLIKSTSVKRAQSSIYGFCHAENQFCNARSSKRDLRLMRLYKELFVMNLIHSESCFLSSLVRLYDLRWPPVRSHHLFDSFWNFRWHLCTPWKHQSEFMSISFSKLTNCIILPPPPQEGD